MKRGAEVLTLIVWLVLALIILVVLLVFLTGGFQKFGQTAANETADVQSKLCSKISGAECVIGANAQCTPLTGVDATTQWIDCPGKCCARAS